MTMNWTQLQYHLNQEDTFADNDGEFQSYAVKDHVALFIDEDNSGNLSRINYVQWYKQADGQLEGIILQLDDASEDPADFLIGGEVNIKVYLEMSQDIAATISDLASNEADCLNNTIDDDDFSTEEQEEAQEELDDCDRVADRINSFLIPGTTK